LKPYGLRTLSEMDALEREGPMLGDVLIKQIRAIAAEMREVAASRECYDEPAVAKELRHFADKLEGIK